MSASCHWITRRSTMSCLVKVCSCCSRQSMAPGSRSPQVLRHSVLQWVFALIRYEVLSATVFLFYFCASSSFLLATFDLACLCRSSLPVHIATPLRLCVLNIYAVPSFVHSTDATRLSSRLVWSGFCWCECLPVFFVEFFIALLLFLEECASLLLLVYLTCLPVRELEWTFCLCCFSVCLSQSTDTSFDHTRWRGRRSEVCLHTVFGGRAFA